MSNNNEYSNSDILGIDLDQNLSFNPSSALNSLKSSSNVLPTINNNNVKIKRKSDKLTYEILTSSKGLPKLIKNIKSIKFHRKNSKNKIHSSSLNNFKKLKYSSDHHFKNLAKILSIFQNWGNNLSPHSKFDKFISNLNTGVLQSDVKHWIYNEIINDKRNKMEIEIDNENKATYKHDYEHEDENETVSKTADLNNNDDIDDDEWPELFGGNTSNNNNVNTNTNKIADNLSNENTSDTNDISQTSVRQKPFFSTLLRTSSSQIPSDYNNDNEFDDEFDRILAGTIDETQSVIDKSQVPVQNSQLESQIGLDDFLSDDDDDENDKGKNDTNGKNSGNLQTDSVFSQYIAKDTDSAEPSTQTSSTKPAATPVDTEEDFFSDDDIVMNL